ncbi:sensor histidine kinase [Edaphobacter modestus]|uniref:histidine kinase n=1 Tax=Edaphobacter modestus TaxID=388466 RepID=A0A4Q7YQV6_9BACT|nr:ATP-binding protein [Edaphobacter modestus]RZU39273.1 heavy metal sensor kinase [Edaphobacter modestus]
MSVSRRSIRVQLTQWYALVVLVALCLFGVVSYVALRQAMAASKSDTLLRREGRIFTYLRELNANQDPGRWLLQLGDYATAAPEGELIQVYSAEGERLYPQSSTPAPKISWPSKRDCTAPCFGEALVNQHPVRTMRHDHVIAGQTVRVCMAGSMVEHLDILHHFRSALLWCLPLVLILSGLGGYLLSARALKPVDRMTKTAVEIGISNLSNRIPVENSGDEVQRLAEAWNDLLSRLEDAVERQRQFTSDASHDLRTSIAVILATGQLTLRHQRTEEEYREAIATMVSECDSTSHLLEDLLLLARGDALPAKTDHRPVNLSALVSEVSQRASSLAAANGQRIDVDTTVEPIVIFGDDKLLPRLLSILIDNAVKYTPAGGSIHVSLQRCGDGLAHLKVQDTGIGISPELLPKIFDRFYRADPVRNRNPGGFGLGLAIAKSVAAAHSAEISVSSVLNRGSTFVVKFPECLAIALSDSENMALTKGH